ncbi:hypothetical protein DF185_04225 [Marinifilum breve]|uniref:Restriction endonuclease type IV Mrr domain-containing protein n=1 Tax=Marinifilum breve TaxID=2184082 RepID=A0A2V4ACY0_9BACT|nr:restriction endonuclease [Marinifilum breve]PXY01864.1 hypothetical protein DF185_04225 [Marinifilum breve]
MIADYTSYITERGAYGMNSRSDNKELFFNEWTKCKYCHNELENIHNRGLVDFKTIEGVNWHKSEGVIRCTKCGWWQHTFHSYLEGEQEGFKDWQLDVNSATLRRFDVSSNEVPILSLRAYLTQQNDKVFEIHHRKMEELVASVFKDHFSCEVKLVGKTNDGGIDLILVNSDTPTLIQVKRRKTKNKTESVKEIRDLLGATVLKGAKNCAFVTTADHFSPKAIDAAKRAITNNIVDTFELFDHNRFFDILNSLGTPNRFEFERLIQLND